MGVRQTSKHELAVQVARRYAKADKVAKSALLTEFIASTGYHRKYAIWLLRHGPPQRRRRRGGRPPTYGLAVGAGLRVVAEALNWICGKRIQAGLADVVPALEREGALQLTPQDRAALLRMSAATIDRRLAVDRRQAQARGLGTTKPGTLLKQQIPVHTFTPWEDQRPGFVEIDLVAHCGTTTAGHYLNTLTVVDVATGWTDPVGVWGKGQDAVLSGLQAVRRRLPFPLLGIDSDNGSEFLNAHLLRYCQQEQLTFTRSRPYWKNDQAHVEQKNYSIVRRLVGYYRYESEEALAQLERVYDLVRPYVNAWQPVFKLIAKDRDGAKVHKRYDHPQTPLRRVLTSGLLDATQQRDLLTRLTAAGPLALHRQINAAEELLWRCRTPSGTLDQPGVAV